MTTNEKKNINANETTESEKSVKKMNKRTIGLIAGATVTVAAVLISMLCLSACNDKKPTATTDEVVIGTSVQTVTQVVTDAQGNTHIEEETKVVEVKQTQPSEKSENETSADKNNNDKSNSNQNNNSNNNQTNLNNSSGNAQSSKINNSSSSGSGQTSKPSSGSSSSSSSSQSKPSSSSSSASSSSGSSSSSSKPAQKDPHEGKTWHEAVYEEVYHPAETTQEWVPYYIDAPIYEYHEAAICNTCGAEITGHAYEHIFEHMDKGENGSYRCETVKEIVGYEKVEVPELGHYETKVINEAYTEKRLVQEAGWY